MERLTKRDEFGNADIIGVDSEELQCNLDFDEFNKVTNALNRLAKYEDLQEQNKLLILPCKSGDAVYLLRNGEVVRNYVVQIHISQTESQTFFSCYGDMFGIEQLGKTVFLTKEQAESVLKETEGKE